MSYFEDCLDDYFDGVDRADYEESGVLDFVNSNGSEEEL